MRKLATFDDAAIEHPTRLITARRVITVDDRVPEATSMLVVGGRIRAIGDRSHCRDRAAMDELTRVEEVDLGDATVVPGFIDAHAHPLMHGQLKTWVDCGPAAAGSISDIVALLAEAARHAPPGRPVRGYGYEQHNLAERRHPTRHELDRVALDREVYLMNASGHGGVVNSYTLALHGVDASTPNPAGGQFFRDDSGELTGEISDAACNILTGLHGVKVGHHGPNFHLDDEPSEHLHQLRLAQADFLAGGVTTIGDCQVSRREFDMYLRLAEAGQLSTRVSMYLLSHLLQEGLDIGMRGAFGNARLSFAGFKFYADGTLGGWTAYFPDGYVGDPCRTGQLYHEPAEYEQLIASAHEAGLQTATHAQSPDALEMVITAIEKAQSMRPDPDARHRIEHCGLPTPAQIRRMAAAGILPVNQPQHYYNWGEGVAAAVGTPGERFNPLGEFVRAGVPVTISSDAPVAEPRPLEAIQAAVTRITRRGVQLGSTDLCISVAEALHAHTAAGAFALGREDDLGSLSVGKRADFAVLGADPFEVPAEDIGAIPVRQTWIDGRCEHTEEPERGTDMARADSMARVDGAGVRA